MNNNDNINDKLTLLGEKVEYKFNYNPDLLERFSNQHPDNEYFVELKTKEFTTLCPITNQPDFASLFISYLPNNFLVESKSLKLYLFSFRNHGDFHEDCINIILKDLVKLLSPKYLEVRALFTPRGGISINPFVSFAIKEYEELKKARFANFHNIGSIF